MQDYIKHSFQSETEENGTDGIFLKFNIQNNLNHSQALETSHKGICQHI